MKIFFVTTTLSKSPEDLRFQLALKTCQAARKAGYPIYIVDGSPQPGMGEMLVSAGATMVVPENGTGMGASRRQCLWMALDFDADIIVWLEPEKHTIVPLLGQCIDVVKSGRAKIVIPRRKNLDGYPQYQQLSEFRGNWEIGNILGRTDLDLYVGPRIMDREAAELMASYDGLCGNNTYGDRWEILFIPIVQMIARNWSVDSVLVNYVHPHEQFIEDDEAMRNKRDEQFSDLVTAMKSEAIRLGIKGLC